MLGKISLTDPSNFEFLENHLGRSRFKKSYDRAFLPWSFQSQGVEIFCMGTLSLGEKSPDRGHLGEKLVELFRNLPTEDFIAQMDGLFFIYLFDRNRKKHLLINNHYQLTKIYYTLSPNQLLFADRMETLLDHLESPQPHFPSVLGFLRNGFNQSDETQLKDVKKLLPTFWIEVDREGFKLRERWKDHFKIDRRPFKDLEEKLDQYEVTYQNALRDYLTARNPESLSMLLSGGHDTSFALIQASKVYDGPIHCFTTSFGGWGFSEHKYAEHICEKFGGIFHPQEFSGKDLDLVIDLILSNEEPVLGSSLPLHALSQTASTYSNTLIGGDGGDTLWGEYFPVGEYHRWVKNLSPRLRSSIHSASLFLRNHFDWERFWELEHVAKLFAEENPYDDFLGRLCTYRHFDQNQLNRLLAPEFSGLSPSRSALMIDFNKEYFDDALIEGKLYNGFFTYQSAQQTRSAESFGMEFFLPSVQRDVANFINGLPHEWLNGGTTFHRLTNSKTINRRFHKHALGRYLKREEIYNRSFDIPWHLILRERKSLLNLLQRALERRGWYQTEFIRGIFREFETQKYKDYELLELKSHGYRVMALLSLEVWARLYLDGKNRDSFEGVTIEDFLE